MSIRRAFFPLLLGVSMWLSACDASHSELAAPARAVHAVTLAEVPLTGPVLTGAAALHEHVMAEHAFSGKWHWGSVEGSEAVSMAKCDGDRHTHAGALGICFESLLPLVPHALGRDTCCHSGGARECAEKRTDGYLADLSKAYREWPVWDTKAHPQYFHADLKKALAGGLKLMLFEAVENYGLCAWTKNETTKPHPFRGSGYDCDHGDSYNSVERQINAMKSFVSNHSDFLEIAATPAMARSIISAGKMAIVIGIEADYAWGNARYPLDLKTRLQAYHDLGARHIYLAHSINTRLAGAALYDKAFWAQQSMANCLFKNKQCTDADPSKPADAGHDYELKNSALCTGWPNYAKNFGELCEWSLIRTLNPDKWNGFQIDGIYSAMETLYDGTPVTVVKNNLGLTADGELVVKEMMKKGMLLEVSHLSEKTIAAMYDLAVANHSYPLMSSHSYARALTLPANAVEFALSDETLLRIKNTDGIIGHFILPDKALTFNDATYNGVANNCAQSSRSLAQYMSYARSKGVMVAWAGDFMGLATGVAPRRGYATTAKDWCEGNPIQQALQGPAYNPDLSTYTSADARGRAYYYTRGYGHHGLIKYLHEDLAAIGLATATLSEYRDHAAENFVRVWEKAEYIATTYPIH